MPPDRTEPSPDRQTDALASGLRKTIAIVALANLAYFFIEFAVARYIGSVSLFADSVDFLEDAAVNSLILMALGWSLAARARVGMAMAGVLLLPALAFLWTLWNKFQAPVPPEPWLLSASGLGALAVNLACARALARFRHHSGSLTKAAFLSARNDALANVAIVGAGVLTLFWPSHWPDVVVGLGIAFMNADAAREVWEAARQEQAEASA
jgi:Co/Zn/Cd efflux system component